MNRETLYQRTVDILFAAYFNDTLNHSSCAACAVGNLLSANGVPYTEYIKDNDYYNSISWRVMFCTSSTFRERILIEATQYTELYLNDPATKSMIADSKLNLRNVKRAIEATGYQVSDLMRIEFAFESAKYGESKEDWMFQWPRCST